MIYISTYKQIQNMFEITNPSYPLLNKNMQRHETVRLFNVLCFVNGSITSSLLKKITILGM